MAADLRLVAGGLDSVEHAYGVRPAPSLNRDALALRTPAGPALAGLRAPDGGGRARRRHQAEPGRDLWLPRPASQMNAGGRGTALFVTIVARASVGSN